MRFAITLVLLSVCTSVFAALDFSQYHTQDQIAAYLRQMASDNPSLVHFYVLGHSDENREIAYISLTKGNEQLPGIYFNGTHHGNEWSSTEGILGLIDYLITNKDSADVSALLSKYVFYMQPLVNPDGHFHQTREEIHGLDPNRDYTWPGGSSSTQWKTTIIPLVKGFLDSHKIRAAAAYHSGIEEIIWPWCYTGDGAPDANVLYTLGKKTAEAMNYSRYMQSYDDYETEGEFVDYAYMTQKTLALTFEVSSEYTPDASELAGVVTRSVDGAMAFIDGIRDLDNGTLPIENQPTHHLAGNTGYYLWKLLGFRLE